MTGKVRITRQKRIDWAWGYGMILPLLAGLGLFYFYPVYKVFRDSLYTVGAFNRSSWAGLANYTKMFQDSVMWRSLGNTTSGAGMYTGLSTSSLPSRCPSRSRWSGAGSSTEISAF